MTVHADEDVAVEALSSAELQAAIERTAVLLRADLQALGGQPLPRGLTTQPKPAAPVAERPAFTTGAASSPARPRSAPRGRVAQPRRGETRPARSAWRLAIPPLIALLLLATALGFASRGRWGAGNASVAVALPTPAATSTAPATGTPMTLPVVATPTLVARPTEVGVTPTFSPSATPPGATVVAAPPSPTVPPRATATPPPTATPLVPAALVAQVAAAEAALRSGRFEVTIDYGEGVRSAVSVEFDLGARAEERRFALTSTWTGRTGQQQLAIIAIDDQVWQRRPDGGWQPGVSQDGLWEQFQAYLPQIRTASNVAVIPSGDLITLRWADPARAADLELQIETVGGRPRQLREVSRSNGLTMVVTYVGWGTPVTITPPAR